MDAGYNTTIMKVKITKDEYEDILRYITIPTGVIFCDEIKESYLQGSKELIEEMLNKLSSHLMNYGIDEKGEINYIGYDIERIIDKLSFIYDTE